MRIILILKVTWRSNKKIRKSNFKPHNLPYKRHLLIRICNSNSYKAQFAVAKTTFGFYYAYEFSHFLFFAQKDDGMIYDIRKLEKKVIASRLRLVSVPATLARVGVSE